MHRLISLSFAVLTLLVAIACAADRDVEWAAVPDDEQAACTASGGTWRLFKSTHRDPCELQHEWMAGHAMSWGCDCGPSRCSVRSVDKVTCVDNPFWHHAGTRKYH